MTMPEAMKEATHTLLQRGPSMRTYAVEHPPPVHDLTNAYDTHARKFRTDSKGTVSNTTPVRVGEGATCPGDQKHALQMQQQRNPWCTHQLIPFITKVPQRCAYELCPGFKRNNKRRRSYTSTMKCEDCSVLETKEMHFCMGIFDNKVQNCHYKYHFTPLLHSQ